MVGSHTASVPADAYIEHSIRTSWCLNRTQHPYQLMPTQNTASVPADA